MMKRRTRLYANTSLYSLEKGSYDSQLKPASFLLVKNSFGNQNGYIFFFQVLQILPVALTWAAEFLGV
jgi:hypothetical protein